MSCFLTSGQTQVEVGVISWSTTLRSSMTPLYSQSHTWFQAWAPNQDSLQMTFRQSSPDAQRVFVSTLFFWSKNHSTIRIEWPERNMDYQAIVAGSPQRVDFDVVMNDISVTFLLLTNKFIQSQAPVAISDNVLSMLGDKFVSKSLDDMNRENALQQQKDDQKKDNAAKNQKNLMDKAKAAMKGNSDYKVEYNPDGTAVFTFKDYSHPSSGTSPLFPVYPQYRVTVKVTQDLIDKMNKGDDLPHYLLTHRI